jgi:type IV secretory pathway protease TraF
MGTPFLDENGRTLVPVRKLLETIGAELTYDQCACTVRAVRGETAVVIRIGQKVIAVNGEETAVDSKAVIIDGRTYLPARAVLEAFGYSLSWSDASKTIYVWD